MTAAARLSTRVLVVSACSKRKLKGVDALGVDRGEIPARERYAGRAHARVRDAVDRWRESGPTEVVEWSIVSAGCGLVDEHDPIPAYEATFNGLGLASTRELGHDLGVPRALQDRMATSQVVLIVLPLVYLQATGAPFPRPETQLYFTTPAFGRQHQSAPIVPCGLPQARELRVTSREIAAARFSEFVDDVTATGLSTALRAWGHGGRAK